MNLSELKEKIKTALKEEADKPHEKYNFRMTFQYRMLGLIIGFGVILSFCQLLVPNLLTDPILTPINGGFTILTLFPVIILGYVLVICSESFGCFMVDEGIRLVTDIRRRAGLPTYIEDSTIMIVLFVFVIYKLVFPTMAGMR